MEFHYVVQTRPGASHHAADIMSRISTLAEDVTPIPDAVPCLVMPNLTVTWQVPRHAPGGDLSPLTLAELFEGQAEDTRCQGVRATMDGNDKSRIREDANGLLVRVAPLDGSLQVYVPRHLRYGVMMREHYPPQAGHPGGNKM